MVDDGGRGSSVSTVTAVDERIKSRAKKYLNVLCDLNQSVRPKQNYNRQLLALVKSR